MSLPEQIKHKRSATFRTIRSLGFDLTGWVITGQTRFENSVTDMLCRPVFPLSGGLLEIEVPASETAGWPIGFLLADIRAVNGTEVVITETFIIRVEKEITQ